MNKITKKPKQKAFFGFFKKNGGSKKEKTFGETIKDLEIVDNSENHLNGGYLSQQFQEKPSGDNINSVPSINSVNLDESERKKINDLSNLEEINDEKKFNYKSNEELIAFQINENLNILKKNDESKENKNKKKEVKINNDILEPKITIVNENCEIIEEKKIENKIPTKSILKNKKNENSISLSLEIPLIRSFFSSFHAIIMLKIMVFTFLIIFVSTIYKQHYVSMISNLFLGFILSFLMISIFDHIINDIQYFALLKDLKLNKLGKDRKSFIKQNMEIGNTDDLNLFRFLCCVGGPILGFILFFMDINQLKSFEILLHCFIILTYFFLIMNFYR